MKNGKVKLFAVHTPEGYICTNVIRPSILSCIQAHEKLFPHAPWYVYKEQGYEIKRVKVKTI